MAHLLMIESWVGATARIVPAAITSRGHRYTFVTRNRHQMGRRAIATLMVLDRGTGARMLRLFLEDLQHTTEITAPEFRRRSWRARLAERAANLLTKVL
jgi:hypothetical protein